MRPLLGIHYQGLGEVQLGHGAGARDLWEAGNELEYPGQLSLSMGAAGSMGVDLDNHGHQWFSDEVLNLPGTDFNSSGNPVSCVNLFIGP